MKREEIMDKLKKNSKIKETSILADSKFFTEKDMVPTDVPMMNVALSGSIPSLTGSIPLREEVVTILYLLNIKFAYCRLSIIKIRISYNHLLDYIKEVRIAIHFNKLIFY